MKGQNHLVEVRSVDHPGGLGCIILDELGKLIFVIHLLERIPYSHIHELHQKLIWLDLSATPEC